MPRTPVRFAGSLSYPGLQGELNETEALFLELKVLTTDGNDTIGEFDQTADELPALVLLPDPNHNIPPPNGTVLVCRGKAKILSSDQKVAAFRRRAATASTPSAPAAGTGGTPSAPPAAGASDGSGSGGDQG